MEIRDAVRIYIDRRERREHPDGKFDKQGRWYPSDTEEQVCCAKVRSPSRSFPYSFMVHCRTIKHIANLTGITEVEIQKASRIEFPPQREGGENYYKQVALRDGKYISIYDGITEYILGQELKQTAHQGHKGGFYCYRSSELAKEAEYPDSAKLLKLPRIVLKIRAEGQYCTYKNGKLAFSRITPMEVVE